MYTITNHPLFDFGLQSLPLEDLDIQLQPSFFAAESAAPNFEMQHPKIDEEVADAAAEIEDYQESSSESIDKTQRRRINNLESARRMRERTNEKLQRLDELESAISEFSPASKSY